MRIADCDACITRISILTAALKMNSILLSALTAIGPAILCMLVLSAAWIDCKTFRIPNRLVGSGLAFGLCLNMALPAGDGLFSMIPGGIGIWLALAGAATGFGALFPLYLMSAMGAGDVKLMSMIGAFLGPRATVSIILIAFVVGGALSIAIAIKNKKLRLLLRNMYEAMLGVVLRSPLPGIGKIAPPRLSAGRMPYGVVIASGLFLYLLVDDDNGIALLASHFIDRSR